jgi:hypothetical protein
VWVGAIAAGTWLVVGALLTTITGYLRASGSATGPIVDAFIVSTCILYILVLARVSVTLIADLVALRAARARPADPPVSSYDDD